MSPYAADNAHSTIGVATRVKARFDAYKRRHGFTSTEALRDLLKIATKWLANDQRYVRNLVWKRRRITADTLCLTATPSKAPSEGGLTP
jgi:hypothetical protein